MPTYQYTVRDSSGNAESGLLAADSTDHLKRSLRASDLYLISCKEVGDRSRSGKSSADLPLRSGKVPSQDVIILLKQLSTFVRAGLSMDAGLEAMARQSRNGQLRKVLQDVRSQVLQGSPLSVAMRRHGSVFDAITLSLVEAGEDTGMLPATLRVAADQLERRNRIVKTIKSATIYPKIVIAVTVMTVAAMLLLVVPTFQEVYRQFRSELPVHTQLLLNLSKFLQTRWWLVFPLVAGSVYGGSAFLKTAAGRRYFDLLVLKTPFLSDLVRKIAMTRFAHTFTAATKGGVPVLRSLNLAGSTVGNSVIRAAVLDATNGVRSGGRLSTELERTGEFPVLMTRMMASGEESGQLERMLEEITLLYEEEVDETIGRLGKVIEPVLAVIVGGIVLCVMLALYTPIFNLTRALKK
jgi:type IV pilus assembly protein PilC